MFLLSSEPLGEPFLFVGPSSGICFQCFASPSSVDRVLGPWESRIWGLRYLGGSDIVSSVLQRARGKKVSGDLLLINSLWTPPQKIISEEQGWIVAFSRLCFQRLASPLSWHGLVVFTFMWAMVPGTVVWLSDAEDRKGGKKASKVFSQFWFALTYQHAYTKTK
jgi:hypothetical protein